MDLHTATQIAQEYIARYTGDEYQIVLFPCETIEKILDGYSSTGLAIHRSWLLVTRL
jgi:hypothetical protein